MLAVLTSIRKEAVSAHRDELSVHMATHRSLIGALHLPLAPAVHTSHLRLSGWFVPDHTALDKFLAVGQ